jgi:hypothetical protein
MFGLYFGGENCLDIANGMVADDFPRVQNLIADGKVKYDGLRAEACFAALASQACSDDREREPCTEMLDGTIAIGGACSSNAECRGGDTYCKNEGACPGRCAPLESAEGPCSTNEDCQSGLRCNRVEGRCFRPAGAGDRCGGRAAVGDGGTPLWNRPPECSAGLFCLGADSNLLLRGTCRTIEESFSGSSGDPCLGDAAACQPDLRCALDTARSTQFGHCLPPVSSGAACKIAGPEMCPDDEYCAADFPSTVDGTCYAKPGAGEACAWRFFDTFCAPGTICDARTCRPRQNLGGSCETYRVCYSEHCLNGRCAPKGACE